MNAPSIDIKDMLLAESALGLAFATNLFVSSEPSTPPNCVTIYDTPGRNTMTIDKKNYEYPSVQIRVRNLKFEDGWDLIEAIKSTLHGRANETWNGTFYSLIVCANGPFQLAWDDNNRVLLIANFNVQRR